MADDEGGKERLFFNLFFFKRMYVPCLDNLALFVDCRRRAKAGTNTPTSVSAFHRMNYYVGWRDRC